MSIAKSVGTALLFGAEGLRQLYSGDGSVEVAADSCFFDDAAVVRRTPLQRFRQVALAVLTAVRLFRAIRRRRAAITQLLARATNGITAQIRHFPAVPLLKRAEGASASEAPSLASFTATPALDALVRDALRGRLQHSAERTRSLAWKLFLGIIPPYLAPADWEASLGQSRARYDALLEKHTPALEAAEAEYSRRAARESVDGGGAARASDGSGAEHLKTHRYPFWFADLVKDLPRIRLMVTTTHELRRSRRSAAERAARRAARSEAARWAQNRPRTPPSTPSDRPSGRCESPTPHFRRPRGGGGDNGGDNGALFDSSDDSFVHISDDDVFEEMLLHYDDARAAMPKGGVSGMQVPDDGGGDASPTSPSPRPLRTRNAFGSDEVRAKMKRILFCWTAEHADGVQSEGALGYVQGMQDLLGVLFFAVQVDALPPDDECGDGGAGVDSAGAPKSAGCESPATRRQRRMRGRRVGGDVEKAGRSLLGTLLNPDFIEHDAYLLFTALMVHVWPLFDMEIVAPASPRSATATAAASSSSSVGSGGAAPDTTPPPAEQPLCFALCSLAQRSVLPLLDAGLAAKLQRLELEPTMYMVKWLLPLFRRELPTRGVLRLWDCLLASCLAARLDQGAVARTASPAHGPGPRGGVQWSGGEDRATVPSAGSGGGGGNIVTRIAQRAQQDISNLARGFEDGVSKGTSAFGGRVARGSARDSTTTLDGRNLALTHGAFVSTGSATSLQPSPLLSTAVLIAAAMLQRSLCEGAPFGDDDAEEGVSGGADSGEAATRAPRPSKGGGGVDDECALAEERLGIMQTLMSGYQVRGPSLSALERRLPPLSDAARARNAKETARVTAVAFGGNIDVAAPSPLSLTAIDKDQRKGDDVADATARTSRRAATRNGRHQSFARVGWTVPADAESSGGGDGDAEAIAVLKAVARVRNAPAAHAHFASWCSAYLRRAGGGGDAAPLLAWHTGLAKFMRQRADERLGFSSPQAAATAGRGGGADPTDLRVVAALMFDPCSRALVVASERGPPRPFGSAEGGVSGGHDALLADAASLLRAHEAASAESAAAGNAAAGGGGSGGEVETLRAEVARLLSLVAVLSAGPRPTDILEGGAKLQVGPEPVLVPPASALLPVSLPAHDWHVIVTEQRRGLGVKARPAIVLSVSARGIETRDAKSNAPVNIPWGWGAIDAVANSSSDPTILKIALCGNVDGSARGGKQKPKAVFGFTSKEECAQTFQRILRFKMAHDDAHRGGVGGGARW